MHEQHISKEHKSTRIDEKAGHVTSSLISRGETQIKFAARPTHAAEKRIHVRPVSEQQSHAAARPDACNRNERFEGS